MPYLTACKDGTVLLSVHVQPKASRNAVTGLHDGCLKLSVTTPPVDGKANAAVAAFLAEILGVGRRDVRLHSGQTSRRKVFQISGTTIEEVREHIQSIFQK
jgi:hypothetical protein